MKKILGKIMVVLVIGSMLQGCVANNEVTPTPEPTPESIAEPTAKTNVPESKITKEMAYEGVNNYCHNAYDWSVAEENPSMMYVTMGEESETEYQVVFRSYTGAVVYFYVDKSSGMTRMVEYVPTLDITNEAGNIDIYDYLMTSK